MVKLLSVSVHLTSDVACLKFYFTAKRSATLDTSSRKRGLKLYYRVFYRGFILFCWMSFLVYRFMPSWVNVCNYMSH